MKLTANMVTLGRIALLPVPCAMILYGTDAAQWVAFFFLTFLGMTDFIDGYMARKEGPTLFGEIIDPAADKIFVATITLSLVGVGVFGPWVAAVILSREFLLTALRTGVSLRGAHLKTSQLGKIKTIVQMGGFGTAFLTWKLPQTALIISSSALAICFLIGGLCFVVRRRRVPYYVWPVMVAFIYVALLRTFFSQHVAVMGQVWMIIILTWASGIDYIIGSWRLFRQTGFSIQDGARLMWAVAYSVGVVFLASWHMEAIVPILISMSFELALGGIDSVVAAKRHHASIWPFALSGCAAIVVSFIGYGNLFGSWGLDIFMLTVLLAIFSGILCVTVYVRWWDLFKKDLAL